MQNKKGFTLLELLVVVLIIGILAGIALPQYQKAVHKARMTEAVIRLKSLRNGIDMWLLEHGQFPSSVADGESLGAMLEDAQASSTYFTYSGGCDITDTACNISATYKIGGKTFVHFSQTKTGQINSPWVSGSCNWSGNIAKKICDVLL